MSCFVYVCCGCDVVSISLSLCIISCLLFVWLVYAAYSMRASNFLGGGDCYVASCVGLGFQLFRVDLHLIEYHLLTTQPFAHVP